MSVIAIEAENTFPSIGRKRRKTRISSAISHVFATLEIHGIKSKSDMKAIMISIFSQIFIFFLRNVLIAPAKGVNERIRVRIRRISAIRYVRDKNTMSYCIKKLEKSRKSEATSEYYRS